MMHRKQAALTLRILHWSKMVRVDDSLALTCYTSESPLKLLYLLLHSKLIPLSIYLNVRFTFHRFLCKVNELLGHNLNKKGRSYHFNPANFGSQLKDWNVFFRRRAQIQSCVHSSECEQQIPHRSNGIFTNALIFVMLLSKIVSSLLTCLTPCLFKSLNCLVSFAPFTMPIYCRNRGEQDSRILISFIVPQGEQVSVKQLLFEPEIPAD